MAEGSRDALIGTTQGRYVQAIQIGKTAEVELSHELAATIRRQPELLEMAEVLLSVADRVRQHCAHERIELEHIKLARKALVAGVAEGPITQRIEGLSPQQVKEVCQLLLSAIIEGRCELAGLAKVLDSHLVQLGEVARG